MMHSTYLRSCHLSFGKNRVVQSGNNLVLNYITYRTFEKKSDETHDKWERDFHVAVSAALVC
jgi:hypothetical protein